MTVKELRDILNELVENEWGDTEVAMMVEDHHRSIDFYVTDTEEDCVYFMTGVEQED